MPILWPNWILGHYKSYFHASPMHSTQIRGLDHFLFLKAFNNFLGVYVPYKVDMHQKKPHFSENFWRNQQFCSFFISSYFTCTFDFKPKGFLIRLTWNKQHCRVCPDSAVGNALDFIQCYAIFLWFEPTS